MPIFAYLIVQGFFYTKDLKKYIFRIFILATITQLSLLVLGYINQEYYPNYMVNLNGYLGVLYSYALSLILLTIIDKKIIIKKIDEKQNLLLRINMFILIILTYLKLKIEFDMIVPFIILELYGIEKFFEKDNKLLLKQQDEKQLKKRILYLSMILLSFIIASIFIQESYVFKYAILGAIVFIAFYNGKRGNKNKFVQSLLYMIFPLQYMILYLVGMIQ